MSLQSTDSGGWRRKTEQGTRRRGASLYLCQAKDFNKRDALLRSGIDKRGICLTASAVRERRGMDMPRRASVHLARRERGRRRKTEQGTRRRGASLYLRQAKDLNKRDALLRSGLAEKEGFVRSEPVSDGIASADRERCGMNMPRRTSVTRSEPDIEAKRRARRRRETKKREWHVSQTPFFWIALGRCPKRWRSGSNLKRIFNSVQNLLPLVSVLFLMRRKHLIVVHYRVPIYGTRPHTLYFVKIVYYIRNFDMFDDTNGFVFQSFVLRNIAF